MKLSKMFGWSSALCLSVFVVQAQETNETEKLNKQLKQLQENFEKQQAEMKANFERMMREQQVQIDALKKQLETTPNAVAVPTNHPAGAEQAKEVSDRVEQGGEA